MATSQSGPPRTSSLDDIVHYICSSIEGVGPSLEQPFVIPEIAVMVLKKFVLSYSVAHVEYLKSLLGNIEDALAERQELDLTWLELQQAELFRWNRRLSAFCEQTETAIDNLRLLPEPHIRCSPLRACGNECDDDFQYIHRRMRNMKTRMLDLVSVVNGLIAILEAKQSINATVSLKEVANLSLGEAKTVRSLNVLGMMFLPMALVASVLSIPGNLAAGEPQFWVYWAVSVPLVCVVLLFGTLAGSFGKIR